MKSQHHAQRTRKDSRKIVGYIDTCWPIIEQITNSCMTKQSKNPAQTSSGDDYFPAKTYNVTHQFIPPIKDFPPKLAASVSTVTYTVTNQSQHCIHAKNVTNAYVCFPAITNTKYTSTDIKFRTNGNLGLRIP